MIDQQRRPRGFYVGVLALPILMLLYLIASGRAGAFWHGFDEMGRPGPSTPQDGSDFLTSLLWFGSLAPLGFAAWEIGREHTPARRLNYALLLGLREVVRRALGLADPASERERGTGTRVPALSRLASHHSRRLRVRPQRRANAPNAE